MKGFAADTKKADIVNVLNEIFKDVDVEAKYSTKIRADKGFVRFKTLEEKQVYMNSLRDKPKPTIDGTEFKISPKQSFERREQNFKVYSLKNILERNDINENRIDVDPSLGFSIVWVDDRRVAEMRKNDEKLTIKVDVRNKMKLGFSGKDIETEYEQIVLN